MSTQPLKFLLTADDKASSAFARVRGEMSSLGQSSALLSKTLGVLGPALAAAFSVSAVTGFVRNTVNGIDALNDLKDATGASIENLSALEDIALRTGTSLDTAGSAVLKLNQALNAASDPASDAALAFKAIGLNVEELKRQDPVQALQAVGVALAGFADNGNKGRIILQLLGRSAKDLAPVLNDLAQAGQLNATVTTEQAQAAAAFNQELFALQKNSLDLSRALAGPLIQEVNRVISLFREGAKEGRGFFEVLIFGTEAVGAGAAAREVKNLRQELALIDGLLSNQNLMAQRRVDLEAKRRTITDQLGNAERRAISLDNYSNEGRNATLPSLPAVLGGDKAPRKPGKAGASPAWPVDSLAVYQADQLREAMEAIDKLNGEWQPATFINSADLFEAELLRKAFEEIEEVNKRAEEQLQKSAKGARELGDNVGDQLGLVFSSAAGEAIRNFESLRDVLKGVLADIQQIALKKLVTDPLSKFIGDSLGGFNLASLFGGFRADGGPVSSGRAYIVGERGPEMFVPRSSGSIVPNGGGVVINQVLNVGSGVNRNEVAAAMVAAKNAAVAEVSDAYRRGRSQ